MSKHPVTVEGFDGTLEDLAKKIGALRYDAAAELFTHLGREYQRQSDGDRTRGYAQLSNMLEHFARGMSQLASSMERIWLLCKPHMNP